jgi:cytidylate kinase
MGTTFGPLITVSATYGTGGSVIAPRLAEAMGLPFVDRLISADTSQDAALAAQSASERVGSYRPWEPSAEAGAEAQAGAGAGIGSAARSKEGLTDDEQTATPAGRFLSYFARAASVGAMMAPDTVLDDDDTIRTRTEEGLRPLATGAPAVLLGRAGAVVLASRPRAFHVRLDGPVERRVAWASSHENVDLEATKRRQSEADKARSQFVKRLFRVDPSDFRLYHLVLDPTVLGIDASVRVLRVAAEAFFDANPAT